MTSVQSKRGSADLAARRGPGSGAPIGSVKRDAKSGVTFRRILGYLRPFRGQLILAALLLITASITALLAPWLQGVAIDEFIATGDRLGLRSIVLVLAGVYLLAWLASVSYSRITVHAVLRQEPHRRPHESGHQRR